MDQNVDLAKLVGAASAPVALIIATCIYLGNLTTKYNSLFSQIRSLSDELRQDPENPDRNHSLHEQLRLYEHRINGTMSATFWLNVAIVCFVSTVAFTGISMLLPGNEIVVAVTAGVMFGGLVIVAMAIVIELWSNRLAKPTLATELKSGTPRYRPEVIARS